ncbi:unnamed protein product [Cyclocybe aegerita]|uniref:MYND-type domain-containing protein n=1 Tax=Cyclocybe aegerita TaxID=1973307 RepID=A0A8S0XJD6_CYCAE|nr:unnamed protein product [Cyclocybe aegerita]
MPRKKTKSTRQADTSTAEQAMEFFLSSIRDPHKVTHCGRCLCGALLTAVAAEPDRPIDTPEKLPASIRKNLEFWNLLLSFFVTPRTDEEIDCLLTAFSECRCQLTESGIHIYHEKGEKAEEGSMNRTWMEHYAPPEARAKYSAVRCTFVVQGFAILCAGLHDGGIEPVAKGVTHTWPSTPLDLVPFGADELVQTMLQWYRLVPDPIVIQLTTRILHTTRFVLIPSLYKYRFAHTFVDIVRNILDLTVAELAKPEPTSEDVKANRMRYNHLLRGLLDFLHEVVDELPQDSISDVIFGCETKIMQLCSMIVYLSSDLRLRASEILKEETVTLFAAYGQTLFRFFHIHMYPRPNIPLHPDIVKLDNFKFPPPTSVRTVPKYVICDIAYFHNETRCSACKCPNSIQSAGKNFQRCSRCHAVSYCGRQCQTVAWRDEKFPHKRICRAIRFLIDAAGGPGYFWHIPNAPQAAFLSMIPGVQVEPFLAFESFILENWRKAGITEDHEDLNYVYDWSRSIAATRNMPDGSKWTPGFPDYEEALSKLTVPLGRGPRRKHFPSR